MAILPDFHLFHNSRDPICSALRELGYSAPIAPTPAQNASFRSRDSHWCWSNQRKSLLSVPQLQLATDTHTRVPELHASSPHLPMATLQLRSLHATLTTSRILQSLSASPPRAASCTASQPTPSLRISPRHSATSQSTPNSRASSSSSQSTMSSTAPRCPFSSSRPTRLARLCKNTQPAPLLLRRSA